MFIFQGAETKTIDWFLGVPYAQPPVEKLRFSVSMIFSQTVCQVRLFGTFRFQECINYACLLYRV